MEPLIKSNTEIYIAIAQRKKELGLTFAEMSFEAKQYGITLPIPSLSNYFNRKKNHNLSEKAILFMCHRYNIKVDVVVTKEPYDEYEAKIRLKTHELI